MGSHHPTDEDNLLADSLPETDFPTGDSRVVDMVGDYLVVGSPAAGSQVAKDSLDNPAAGSPLAPAQPGESQVRQRYRPAW